MDLFFAATVESRDIPPIAGLTYIPNYISETDELELVAAIDAGAWDTSWRRRRQPFGGRYGQAKAGAPIPPWGVALAQRMMDDGISTELFDHMLVNEYLPGQGISSHADYDPFDRTVVSLSLLSACVMDFRQLSTGQRERLLLEPRSLLVLSDVARYDWQHGIAPRRADQWHGTRVARRRRLSVTFRKHKHPPDIAKT